MLSHLMAPQISAKVPHVPEEDADSIPRQANSSTLAEVELFPERSVQSMEASSSFQTTAMLPRAMTAGPSIPSSNRSEGPGEVSIKGLSRLQALKIRQKVR